ncbi:unnamed protein product, partial [marine sediment metagenome]
AKIAATVAGSTTITSIVEMVHGGISIFAIAAGAVLSLSLIIIHWQRWWAEQKKSNKHALMEHEEYCRKKKSDELEIETLNLKMKVLQMELKDEKEKKDETEN